MPSCTCTHTHTHTQTPQNTSLCDCVNLPFHMSVGGSKGTLLITFVIRCSFSCLSLSYHCLYFFCVQLFSHTPSLCMFKHSKYGLPIFWAFLLWQWDDSPDE